MKNEAALLFSVLLLAGCSVKEDRSACPAFLNLSLSNRALMLARDLPVKLLVSDAKGEDTLELDASNPSIWHEVEKGMVTVESLLSNGAGTSIAWGAQSDSLWASVDKFYIEEEQAHRQLSLHKRFATIWFIFDKGIPLDDYSFLIQGYVAGTDLTKMSPMTGDFRYLLAVREETASARLPPQKNDSPLILRCNDASTGKRLWDWDLSKELLQAGYDWEAEDLKDAKVYIHLAPLSFSVIIGGWRDGGEICEII